MLIVTGATKCRFAKSTNSGPCLNRQLGAQCVNYRVFLLVNLFMLSEKFPVVSLLIARTNFSEFSDDGIIAKNSTRNY